MKKVKEKIVQPQIRFAILATVLGLFVLLVGAMSMEVTVFNIQSGAFILTGIILLLLPFYSTVKIGGIEATRPPEKTEQDTITKPSGIQLPTKKSNGFDPKEILNGEVSKKLLSTLWEEQSKKFPSDKTQRWTFRLGVEHSDYNVFKSEIEKLYWIGLVILNPADNQYFLTDFGLWFCENHEADLGKFSYFNH